MEELTDFQIIIIAITGTIGGLLLYMVILYTCNTCKRLKRPTKVDGNPTRSEIREDQGKRNVGEIRVRLDFYAPSEDLVNKLRKPLEVLLRQKVNPNVVIVKDVKDECHHRLPCWIVQPRPEDYIERLNEHAKGQTLLIVSEHADTKCIIDNALYIQYWGSEDYRCELRQRDYNEEILRTMFLVKKNLQC